MLCITLATRGRAEKLVNTISRSIVNWAEPDTRLWVMADDDDLPTIDAITKAKTNAWGPRVELSVKPREDTIAEKWNRAVTLCPDATVYLVGADDDPYVTPAYDRKILAASRLFPDGIGMVYGRMANASFSGAVAPTAGLVRKMGHIFPEYFPYWFVDHWTDDIARLIGRISFADIATDQSAVGKTQELREPAWWATFFDAAYLMRRQIAADIVRGDDFDDPLWRKQILLSHAPLIEYRSRWINDNVRATARQLEGWSGLTLKDERYQRIRRRAVETLPKFLDGYGMDAAEADMYRRALIPATTIPALKQAG